jgi:hypothetical protein
LIKDGTKRIYIQPGTFFDSLAPTFEGCIPAFEGEGWLYQSYNCRPEDMREAETEILKNYVALVVTEVRLAAAIVSINHSPPLSGEGCVLFHS